MVINEDTTFESIIIYISFGFTAYDIMFILLTVCKS